MNLIIIGILTPLTLIQRMNLLTKISIRKLQKSEFFFLFGKKYHKEENLNKLNYGPFEMAIGHCVTIISCRNSSFPDQSHFALWSLWAWHFLSSWKKRLRSYVMYIPFRVKRTFKLQLGKHKDGTFPFDSSFIKVETDLMCIRREFSFCVLSPIEVAVKLFLIHRFTSCPFLCTYVATDKSAVGLEK